MCAVLETAHPTASLCWREARVWLLSTVTSLERPKSPRSPKQSHWFAAADCFSPSLPVSVTDRPPKNSCGYLPPAKVPLRKWDQAKQETTKAQRERETSQSAGFLCAHKAAADVFCPVRKHLTGQSNHLVGVIQSFPTRFNILLEGVKSSADCLRYRFLLGRHWVSFFPAKVLWTPIKQ